jgi:transposase-like protein
MKHYSAEQRQRIISEWRVSGMTRSAFSKHTGVSQGSLSTWQKRYEQGAQLPAFLPVVVRDTPGDTASSSRVCVEKPLRAIAKLQMGTCSLYIYDEIANEALATVIGALRGEVQC